jgi:hypothetical protein
MPKIRSYIDPAKIIRIALLLLALIPIVVAVIVTVRHWLPLPYWDEWRTPGLLLTNYANGTLKISDFFLQHNESRMAVPCFLYFTFASLHGWDVRDAMTIMLLEDAAICGLVICLLLRTKGATVITALAAFAVITFLCFSPVQYYNFLSGFLFVLFFPGLATILVALVNLSRIRFGAKAVINALIALVATYTFPNGMLLWVLGVPLPAAQESASKRVRLIWSLLFALVGAAAVAAYFVGYERPPTHPPFHLGIVQVVHYLILWVGSYFNSANVSPFVIGIIVLSSWIFVTANAVLLLAGGAPLRHFYPWFLVSIYALSSGLITAIGRVGFGVQQALSNRYAIFSLFLYVGLVGTTFALYCYEQDKRTARWHRLIIAFAMALIVLAAPAWGLCFASAQQLVARTAQRNARLLCALEWMDVFPNNPDLELIFPYVNVLRARSHTIARAGLLPCHLLSPRLVDLFKEQGPSADPSHGRLEEAVVRDASLITSGWIWSSQKNPDCVAIGLRKPTGQFEFLSIIAPTVEKRDIEGRSKKQTMKPLGFRDKTPLSMPGEGIVEAWAVNTTAETASPLAGARRLSVHP